MIIEQSWSSTGPDVELAAPGVGIYSTYWDDTYATLSGTSMACPQVSGTAALVIANESLSNDEVRLRLQQTADDLGATRQYGHGLVDADEAAPPTGNQPPVADAGADQTVSDADGNGVEAVTLDGSGSCDPDGSIDSYEWKEGATLLSSAVSFTCDFSVGMHTVTLTVTDDGGTSSSDDVLVTVTEAPTNTMHVASIEMDTDSTTRGRNIFVWAVATMTIFDESNNPVEGTTVSGQWSNATSDSDSGVTGASGQVSLDSDSVKNPSGGTTFTFTVDGVTKAGWDYDSEANVETSKSINV